MDISDGKRDMLTMENLASSDNTPSKPKSNKFYSHLAHTVFFSERAQWSIHVTFGHSLSLSLSHVLSCPMLAHFVSMATRNTI